MDLKKLVFAAVSLTIMLVILSRVKLLDDYFAYVRTIPFAGQAAYLSAESIEELEVDSPVVSDLIADETLKKIQALADQLNIDPIDARVDPVWKAIPGYNGREVDVEKSLEETQRVGKLQIIFKEISPRISLKDLGAFPVYKGNPNKPMASFMINVAWGNEYIPKMLETLRREEVKATFFFDGSWLENNLDLAKQIAEEGHELSNHAYSHKDMSKLTRSEAKVEIEKTEALLKNQLGVDNTLFAPPSGDYNEETVRIAHDMGLQTVLWTLDTVDWKKPSPDWVIRKITARVEPGSLILMHPTEASSKALLSMIHNIRNKGLKLGTVSELLSPERVEAKIEEEIHEKIKEVETP